MITPVAWSSGHSVLIIIIKLALSLDSFVNANL